jgi:hypothetical protein
MMMYRYRKSIAVLVCHEIDSPGFYKFKNYRAFGSRHYFNCCSSLMRDYFILIFEPTFNMSKIKLPGNAICND